jgi:PIN domain nuclease of toxin-antitoxin system
VIARAKRRSGRRGTASSGIASLPRRVLLDTQVWLWWQTDDVRLGANARDTISRAAEVCVSAASVWEIAIKSALGKLTLPKTYDVGMELETDGFQPMPIDIAHAQATTSLPHIHRDPFDRMLVAQSMVEGLVLITADRELWQYGIEPIDALA